MRIGFGAPVSGAWATPQYLSRFAAQAETAGYGSLWTFQRLLVPEGSAMEPVYHSVLDPMVALGYAAAVTSRIRLGVAVVNMPYLAPAYLAKQAASVDVLSGGRLDLGLGLGWMPEEFAAADAVMGGRGGPGSGRDPGHLPRGGALGRTGDRARGRRPGAAVGQLRRHPRGHPVAGRPGRHRGLLRPELGPAGGRARRGPGRGGRPRAGGTRRACPRPLTWCLPLRRCIAPQAGKNPSDARVRLIGEEMAPHGDRNGCFLPGRRARSAGA